MRGIRSAALAGCLLLALIVIGGAAAEGGPGKPGKGGDAAKACQAKGLKPGTDAFRACLKSQLGGGNKKGGTGDPKLAAAAKACQAKGLTPDTDAFRQCVKGQLGGGDGSKGGSGNGNGTGDGPGAKVAAAAKACQAQGLTPDTDAFRQCMKGQLGEGGDGSKGGGPGTSPGPGNGPGPGDKIAAAAKACQAQGLKPETDAFRACMKAQLSGTH